MKVFIIHVDSEWDGPEVLIYTGKKAPKFNKSVGGFVSSTAPIILNQVEAKKLLRGSGVKLPRLNSNKMVEAEITITQ